MFFMEEGFGGLIIGFSAKKSNLHPEIVTQDKPYKAPFEMYFLRIMNPKWFVMYVCLLSGISQPILGQLTISFPFNGAVFQRTISNVATITVGGGYTGAVDRIEARLVSVSGGQNVDWTSIHINPSGGVFSGSLFSVRGGWYTLEVRSILFNEVVQTTSLSRVGVGEVFIIAGQSNAQGVESHGAKAASDAQGRVKYVSWTLPCPNGTCQNVDPPFPVVATLNNAGMGVEVAPNGISPWTWGELGDAIIARYNVPVLFFNAAASGSSIGNWSRSADGLPSANVHAGILYAGNPNFPYGYLRKALNYYGSMFGVRAVLWHQGESDTHKNNNSDPNDNTSAIEYRDSLKYVINRSRTHSGKNALSWVVARASYFKVADANVVSGQNQTINTAEKIFAGPETDNLQTPRPDGAHIENLSGGQQALSELASRWNNALNSSFFDNATPYSATPPPSLTLSCANNTYSITAPSGYQYFWVTDNGAISSAFAFNQTIFVGGGNYRVYLKDALGNIIVSQTVTVPNLTPQPPIISASTTSISAGQQVTLYAKGCAGTVSWSAGFIGNSIVQTPTQTTVYTTSCSIGSCSSISSSFQVTVCTPNTNVITNFGSGTTLEVKASKTIIGKNSVGSGAIITYDATNSITLQPGFTAEKNSVFKAVVGQGCAN